MQEQLQLFSPEPTTQLSHLGWIAQFHFVDNEIMYTLATPQGKPYSESYTGLHPSKLKQAIAQAKQCIEVMESAPHFVMSPQFSPHKKQGFASMNALP